MVMIIFIELVLIYSILVNLSVLFNSLGEDMDPYIPLITGFIGALIGALASIATHLISSHNEARRQLTKLAYDAALEDHKTACELASKGGPTGIAPLTSYIHFHVRYMELLSKGSLTSETLQNIKSEGDSLWPEPR